jgi:hypothetical protein
MNTKNKILKTNINRARKEIALLNASTRIRQLSATLTNTASRKKKNAHFIASYKSTLDQAEESIQEIRKHLLELEELTEEQSRQDKWSRIAEEAFLRGASNVSSRDNPYKINKNK